MTDADPSRYTIDVVDKAIEVLSIVAASPDLGVSAIARRCGDGRARIFRLIRTLEQRGLIARSADGATYRLGTGALVLGTAAAEQIDITRLAQPIMAELGRAADETVQLRVRDGRESLCVGKWEPDRELRVHAAIGRRRPLDAGSGRLLLAFAPAALQESFPPAVLTELPWLRAAGLVVSRGEILREAIGIAAPVFDRRAECEALLHIGGPAQRFDEARIGEVGELLREAARRLSAALGAPVNTEQSWAERLAERGTAT